MLTAHRSTHRISPPTLHAIPLCCLLFLGKALLNTGLRVALLEYKMGGENGSHSEWTRVISRKVQSRYLKREATTPKTDLWSMSLLPSDFQ